MGAEGRGRIEDDFSRMAGLVALVREKEWQVRCQLGVMESKMLMRGPQRSGV